MGSGLAHERAKTLRLCEECATRLKGEISCKDGRELQLQRVKRVQRSFDMTLFAQMDESLQ